MVGIVNANLIFTNQPNLTAIYGDATTISDLSFYRNAILNIIDSHANFSLMGDVNLDGAVTGNGTGPIASDDLSAMVDGWLNQQAVGDINSWKKGDLNQDGITNGSDFLLLRTLGDINLDGSVNGNGLGPWASDDVTAFVDGWMYQQEVGDVNSWKKGDLNFDGITNVSDFFLLRSALNPSGAGAGLSLASLVGNAGVPEPSSALLAMVAAALVALRRNRRRFCPSS